MKLDKNKTKALLIHYYTYKTAGSEENGDNDQRIIHYLKKRIKKLVHIAHPLPEFEWRYSYLTIYENGIKIKQIKVYILRGPSLFQYFQNIIVTYYFLFVSGFSFNFCIAAANLSFLSIFPLRLYFIKRLIYYSVDFVPQRFINPLLNSIYHFIDKLACKYSDATWVMVKKQITVRDDYNITTSRGKSFILVPIGYETKNIKIPTIDKINFYNLVYMGAIRESMGIQLAIQALPILIKKFPRIKLTIVGTGKYLPFLKKLVEELAISKYVEFTGYIEKYQSLTDLITKKSIGLAPYVPIPGSYSYYSDPSKIKLYMCCGLPVISTKVTTLTKIIANTQSGIIVNYSVKELVDAVKTLLTNKILYEFYKNNAIKLSKKFDTNHILYSAFKKIPK